MGARILVIDDDLSIRLMLETLLLQDGYDVACATDGAMALGHLDREPCDLVIADITIDGELTGLDVLSHLQRSSKACPVIIMTGAYASGSSNEPLRMGAAGLLRKPFTIDEIQRSVARVLEEQA